VQDWRSLRFYELALLLISSALFSYFLAPGLTWLDAGELIAASHSLGLSHAPTQPAYSLLAHLFTYFIPGSIAYRYSVFSLFCGVTGLLISLRVVFFLLETRFHSKWNPLIAFSAVLLLALNPLFYFQMIRQEVYALNYLLNIVGLYFVVCSNRPRWFEAACFVSGLGFAAHSAITLLQLPALLFLASKKTTDKRQYLVGGLYFFLGLTPYFYHAIRFNSDTYIICGDFRTFLAGIKTSLGLSYAGNSLGQNFSLEQFSSSVLHFLKLFFDTWTLPLSLGGLLGITLLAKQASAVGRSLIYMGAILSLLVLFVGMQPSADPRTINPDNGGYLMMVLFILSAGAAVSCSALLQRVSVNFVPWVLALTLLINIFGQIINMRDFGHLRHSHNTEKFIQLVSRSTPQNSLLGMLNDEILFPLLYLQSCEMDRRDLVVFSKGIRLPETFRKLAAPPLPSEGPAPILPPSSQRVFMLSSIYNDFYERLLLFSKNQRAMYLGLGALGKSEVKLNLDLLKPQGFLLQIDYDHQTLETASTSQAVPPTTIDIAKNLGLYKMENLVDFYTQVDFLAASFNNLGLTYWHHKNYLLARDYFFEASNLKSWDQGLKENLNLVNQQIELEKNQLK
jgi:hypothetical protein